MNQINKRCLKELDTYWNERLAYLAQSDRLDDGVPASYTLRSS